MRVLPSPAAGVYLCVFLSSFCFSAFGITLEELRSTPDLTPRKFAAYFRDFRFEFRAEVQPPERFLAARSGDCDDFATLAAGILAERGYTARLVSVRMPGVTHVVCYIEEIESYLDYNNRNSLNRMVSAGPTVEAIAESVARSHQLKWISASEFTYGNGVKRLVQTVVPPGKLDRSMAGLFR